MRRVLFMPVIVTAVSFVGLTAVLGQEERTRTDRDRDAARTEREPARIGAAIDPDTNAPIFKAKTLIGYKVKNPAGENLGKIEELAIDPQTGQIAYTVLSFGGFLGLGDKLFAIPWNALQPRHADETFILNVDKETLKSAPGFDKDKWPNMADRRWGAGIHEFYRSKPYWEERTGARGETVRVPLKLNEGKTYVFQVEPKAGFTSTATTDPSRPGVSTAAAVQERCQYRIRVQDVAPSGDATLMVSVDKGELDKTSPTQVDERQENDPNRRDDPARREGAGMKSCTVMVAADGRIKNVKHDSTQPTPSAAEADCNAHLQLILGSGIHQHDLQVGRVYSGSQLFAGAASASDPSRTDPTRSPTATTQGHATSGLLNALQLRFEGRAKRGDREVAHFTVLSSESGHASASSRPGTAGTTTGTQTESERRESSSTAGREGSTTTRALAGGERQIGEANWRMDDGLLEHLTIEKSASAAASSAVESKLAQGLTIRRVEAK